MGLGLAVGSRSGSGQVVTEERSIGMIRRIASVRPTVVLDRSGAPLSAPPL